MEEMLLGDGVDEVDAVLMELINFFRDGRDLKVLGIFILASRDLISTIIHLDFTSQPQHHPQAFNLKNITTNLSRWRGQSRQKLQNYGLIYTIA